MKLITELTEDVQYITEVKKDTNEKHHFIEGIWIQGDIRNRNGRIYPVETLDKEVSRYVTEMVDRNRAFGELGHPSGPQINLDRVSHIITELKRDGKNFIGKAKLTETPMGNIAKGILESGGQLGVSTRGMGSLKEENGIMVVQPDFKLATAGDIVADPSAPNAFVNGIMENVNWIYDPVKGKWFEEKLEETKRAIKKMSKSQLEERKMAIFEEYVSSLALKF